jgi:hypothetical protein
LGEITKKYFTVIVSIAIICLIFSSATAVPYSTSRPIIEKIEKINDIKTSLKEKIGTIEKNLQGINRISLKNTLSLIGVLLGLIYVAVGLGFLAGTVIFCIMAFVALMFNPGGFFLLLLAALDGILSMIFLTGGFALLFANSPAVAVLVIILIFLIIGYIIMHYLPHGTGVQLNRKIRLITGYIQETNNGGYLTR